MSWYQYISGYNPVLYRYVGFDGKPATSSQYTYDLLREMLIFHSNSFQQ